MAKGGARPGAGRKKGVPNKNQAILREFAQRAASEGGLQDTPLELLLATMRWLHGEAAAGRTLVEGEGTSWRAYGPLELRLMAVDVAAKAAPYCHPRLAQVESNVSATVQHYENSLLELGAEVHPRR